MDVISTLYTKVYALDWYEYGCKVYEFGYPRCVSISNSKNVVLVWWSLWFTQVSGINNSHVPIKHVYNCSGM